MTQSYFSKAEDVLLPVNSGKPVKFSKNNK